MGEEDGIPVEVKPERPTFPRTVSELSPGGRGIHLQAKKNTVLSSHGRPPWCEPNGKSGLTGL